MSVHSDGLLVGKKIYTIKPLVGKDCNRSSVGITKSIQLSVAINMSVGITLYRRRLHRLMTSVGKGLYRPMIDRYNDSSVVAVKSVWYSDIDCLSYLCIFTVMQC